MSGVNPAKDQLLSEALNYLKLGIELLDRAEAPGEIAARIDLAVNQLEELVQDPPHGGRLGQGSNRLST